MCSSVWVVFLTIVITLLSRGYFPVFVAWVESARMVRNKVLFCTPRTQVSFQTEPPHQQGLPITAPKSDSATSRAMPSFTALMRGR